MKTLDTNTIKCYNVTRSGMSMDGINRKIPKKVQYIDTKKANTTYMSNFIAKTSYLTISMMMLILPMSVISQTIDTGKPMNAEMVTVDDGESASIQNNQVNDTNTVSNIQVQQYDDLVRKYANTFNVSYGVMNGIITCENRDRNPNLQSQLKYTYTIEKLGIHEGEREYSFGLVQINLHYNPTISLEQATDPEFSIKFLAENLSKGKGYLWSSYTSGCYKKHL